MSQKFSYMTLRGPAAPLRDILFLSTSLQGIPVNRLRLPAPHSIFPYPAIIFYFIFNFTSRPKQTDIAQPEETVPICRDAAYNEEATLAAIVGRVMGIPHLLELTIVDDRSCRRSSGTCGSPPEIRYVRHEKNAGKTAALKTGFALTRGDVVIVQHGADLDMIPMRSPTSSPR